MTSNRHSGFTLIELMIVVSIVAILATIAYPSYSRYVTQTRRSDAQVGIQQLMNRLEKFFGYCNTYMTSSANFMTEQWPGSCPPVPANRGLGLTSTLTPDGHYLLTIAADNIDGSCTAAAGPCNALAGAALTTCQQQCGYIVTANPNGVGASGRQANDGRFRMDSRGKKQWDKNNDGDYVDAGEDKWK